MKIESNGAVAAQSAAATGKAPKSAGVTSEKIQLTSRYDSFRKADYSSLDENGLPKNFLLGGIWVLPHGHEWEMENQIRNAYDDYYAGKCDEEAVKNSLSEVVEALRSNYVELGFEEKEIMPHIIEDVYNTARLFVVAFAHTASFEDGMELAARYNGHNRNTKDFIYYDANRYYQCEAMKTSLLEHAGALCEQYGIPKLNLPKGYDRDDPRYSYNSYNTMTSHYAGYQWKIGNMLDEGMEPPENFRIFYKSGESGFGGPSCVYVENPEDAVADFYGVLQVWQDDWTFTGRVPTRSDTVFNPGVNLYDTVLNGSPGGIPEKCAAFLKNFDFFHTIQSDNYFRLQYLHLFNR